MDCNYYIHLYQLDQLKFCFFFGILFFDKISSYINATSYTNSLSVLKWVLIKFTDKVSLKKKFYQHFSMNNLEKKDPSLKNYLGYQQRKKEYFIL